MRRTAETTQRRLFQFRKPHRLSIERPQLENNLDAAKVTLSPDQVARLDPKTDEIVEYLLPHSTNIRRVFVDENGPRPVLWVGNNHGAAIVRVEPLD